jgi:hypothetical protein
MGEPDFAGLRAEVEAATVMPEFDLIRNRARRVRGRTRLAGLASVLGTLLVLAPAGIAAQQARAGQHVPALRIDNSDRPPAPVAVPSTSVRVAVRAAAALDLMHVWIALDVCVPTGCNLQVTPLTDAGPVQPVRTSLLRTRPTDRLSDVTLGLVGRSRLWVSGDVGGAGQQYKMIDQGLTADAGSTPPPVARDGEPVGQTRPYGPLVVVDPTSGRTTPLTAQPPLRTPTLFTGVDSRRGIWATGALGGQPAVSVSHDGGRTWSTRRFPATPVDQPPVLATFDGKLAYLFTVSAGRLRQWRSADGGSTWAESSPRMSWPAGADGAFGAVVRPNGSVLVWRDGPPAMVFLESADGRTYRDAPGPAGVVVPVPGGYVLVGERLGLSKDALTWTYPAYNYPVVTD